MRAGALSKSKFMHAKSVILSGIFVYRKVRVAKVVAFT